MRRPPPDRRRRAPCFAACPASDRDEKKPVEKAKDRSCAIPGHRRSCQDKSPSESRSAFADQARWAFCSNGCNRRDADEPTHAVTSRAVFLVSDPDPSVPFSTTFLRSEATSRRMARSVVVSKLRKPPGRSLRG